jgi:FixJ family two-component response regulator
MPSKNKEHFKTIFVVDDEEVFQEAVRTHLSSKYKNANIHCYLSGEDCVKNMEDKPELIVLDYHLAPGDSSAMNGLQTLQALNANSSKAYVVILTGDDSVQVANDTKKHGAFDYIVKGETAFAKLDINCSHILKRIGDAKEIEDFKKFKIGFLIIIILFIVTLYYFTSMHNR